MKVALLSQGVALGFTILPFQGNFSVNLSRSLSLCSVVVLTRLEFSALKPPAPAKPVIKIPSGDHGARVARLCWAIGHDGSDILPKHAGDLTR